MPRSPETMRATLTATSWSTRRSARESRAVFAWVTLTAIIVIGTIPRLYHISQPYFLDLHSWRQSDSAAFTDGYLVESFSVFDPSIARHPCSVVNTPFGRVEAELPIASFLGAIPLKLLGATSASAQYIRLVSVAFFVVGCFLLYGCILELGGDSAAALLAVAAFCAAPLCIFFTRSPQPDGQSLTLAIGTVWVTARYARRRQVGDVVIATLFAAGLLLLKISNAYLLPVLAYVLVVRLGWAAFRDWKLWLALLVVAGATTAWYVHAHAFGWTFGIWADVADNKFSALGQLRNPETWQTLLAKVSWDILTVSGCILTVVGIAVRGRTLLVRVCVVWLACGFTFIALTLNGQLRHIYYQLCLVPPAVIAQGVGIRYLSASGWPARIVLIFLLALHAEITASVLWGSSLHASAEGRSYFTEEAQLRAPIEALRKYVPQGTLFVSSERDPRLYWNANRRGYFFGLASLSEVLRCMDRASDYLLLGPSVHGGWTNPAALAHGFVPVWRDRTYALYRRVHAGSTASATAK